MLLLVVIVGIIAAERWLSVFLCDYIGREKGYPGGRGRFIAIGLVFGLVGAAFAAMIPNRHTDPGRRIPHR